LVVLVALGAAACGKTQVRTNTDGGSDAVGTGRRSFDITAVNNSDGSAGVPTTTSFTLVLDAEAGLAIAGANGQSTVFPVTTTDGRTFRSLAPFDVASNVGACNVGERVRYSSLDITISGNDRDLSGTATGVATVSCGDCSFDVPISSVLFGVPDATPPTLRLLGSVPQSPFEPFGVVASEPLPTGVSARLVADDDGAAIDLVPQVVQGDVPLVVGFSKPDVVLRAGHGYSVTLDGLVDFAGHTDAGPRLQLTGFPAAPVVPQDGFESASGSLLGGAMVVRTGGSLPAIAGDTSLYVGSQGAPVIDSAGGRSLVVKLSRQAGDTRLRVTYRAVSRQTQPAFWGWLRVGSEGASSGSPSFPFGNATGTAEMLTIANEIVYVGPVATVEETLPVDVTGEVLVIIAPTSFS
jgi:hypothetical protein